MVRFGPHRGQPHDPHHLHHRQALYASFGAGSRGIILRIYRVDFPARRWYDRAIRRSMNHEEKESRDSFGPHAFGRMRDPGPCSPACRGHAGHGIHHPAVGGRGGSGEDEGVRGRTAEKGRGNQPAERTAGGTHQPARGPPGGYRNGTPRPGKSIGGRVLSGGGPLSAGDGSFSA